MKYLSDRTLAERLDVSRATVWRWTRAGKLPQPVKLTHGTTRWRDDEELTSALVNMAKVAA